MRTGWSEDRLHRWLARRPRPGVMSGSSGHDAAVLAPALGRDVLCCDQLVEGVHFAPGTPPAKIGRKAAARSLSDLAATAARPRALSLALRAPRDTPESRLRKVIDAVDEEGRRHGAPLVAGDLACAEGPLALTVTALGSFDGRGRPPGRDRARAGQVLVLTGPVGGSSRGRHLVIEPRLAEGRWLAERGATAMMDVSDGLAWDLFRLARSAGVGIELDTALVPIHADAERLARETGRTALDHALHDGEDHELVATLPRRALPQLRREAPRRCPGLAEIGRVVAGRGVVLVDARGRRRWRQDEGGWRHGS